MVRGIVILGCFSVGRLGFWLGASLKFKEVNFESTESWCSKDIISKAKFFFVGGILCRELLVSQPLPVCGFLCTRCSLNGDKMAPYY